MAIFGTKLDRLAGTGMSKAEHVLDRYRAREALREARRLKIAGKTIKAMARPNEPGQPSPLDNAIRIASSSRDDRAAIGAFKALQALAMEFDPATRDRGCSVNVGVQVNNGSDSFGGWSIRELEALRESLAAQVAVGQSSGSRSLPAIPGMRNQMSIDLVSEPVEPSLDQVN